jgi:hypothetical protein
LTELIPPNTMLRPRPGGLVELIAPRPDPSVIKQRASPTFPLDFTEKRRGVRYYLALAVVLSVFGTIPVCFVWVVFYGLRARKWDGWVGAGAFVGFVYALSEVSPLADDDTRSVSHTWYTHV